MDGPFLSILLRRARVNVNYAPSNDDAEKTVDGIRSAGGTAIAVAADVTDQAQAKALMESAVREYGRLDYLINNAGWSQRVPARADGRSDR